MAATIREFEEIHVTVDDVIYMPSLEARPEKPYPFVYFISIHNDSAVAVTIRGRKWVVHEEGGEVVVVEGAGVVGQNPLINPGEHFSYNSYHLAGGPLTAEGSFHGTTQSGERIFTRIPVFALTPPSDPS